MMKGIVFHKQTNAPVSNASICNTRTMEKTYSRTCGSFNICVKEGDTLQITCEGYLRQEFWVNMTQDIVLYLEPQAIPAFLPVSSKKTALSYFSAFLNKSLQKIKKKRGQRKEQNNNRSAAQ